MTCNFKQMLSSCFDKSKDQTNVWTCDLLDRSSLQMSSILCSVEVH